MNTFDDLRAALDAYEAHQRAIPKRSYRIDRWWSWWLREAVLRRRLMEVLGLLFMYLTDLEEGGQ